jgi:carbonic anhydrase
MTLQKLIDGFARFQTEYFKDSDFYHKLARNGQAPETLIIACSDSRNDPAILTQSEPGDIFVVRNVAALVPPYQPDSNYHGTSAAIEFAVKTLKVKNIVVLGHALCGGIQALSQQEGGTNGHEFITHWLTIGEKARKNVEKELSNSSPEAKQKALEQAVILTSLNNLMTFPWIREKVERSEISIHGWYFDLLGGKLLNYDYAEGLFVDLTGP